MIVECHELGSIFGFPVRWKMDLYRIFIIIPAWLNSKIPIQRNCFCYGEIGFVTHAYRLFPVRYC